jgi:redox-sensitive bicupin YhaK (pirin superfamily)
VALGRHRAGDRARTTEDGRDTWHSFSFGAHYAPDNVAYAGLMAHNDDHLAPGAGYPDHAHAGVEIVTWVLDGVLVHNDSEGGSADLAAGTLQVQTAGSGIRHSEVADARSGSTRFVQAWVRPDAHDAPPTRSVVTPGDVLVGGHLVPLASGDGTGLVPIGAAGATLWVARLQPGTPVTLPDHPLQHLFVARGSVTVAGLRLDEGDALRATEEPGHVVALPADLAQSAEGAVAELMVWTFG